MTNVRSTTIGDAQVTIIDVYSIPERLDKLIALPEADRTDVNRARLDRLELLPVQCILIRLGGFSVLVDAGVYDAAFDHSGRSGYVPPPSLLERLAEAGVQPGDIEAIVVTHAHGDHYNALTTETNDDLDLTFPNASVYVGLGDWEAQSMQEALRSPTSLEAQTLGVLHRAGRLLTVESHRDLAPGMSIIASPGETPGHLSVRVHSRGQTLYCIGDLYHHVLEVDHPTWAVPWATPATIQASREEFVMAATTENARAIATHIAGIGRLQQTSHGVTWVEA